MEGKREIPMRSRELLLRVIGLRTGQWRCVVSVDTKEGIEGCWDIAGIAGFEASLGVREQLRRFVNSREDLLVIEADVTGFENSLRVIVERPCGRRKLFVFGAGHVGRSIAMIGEMLGLDVMLLDDRQEFLNNQTIVDSSIRPCLVDFDKLGEGLGFERSAAVVIVTRGHQSDEAILKQVSGYEVAYVGMIGSRRRVAGVFKRLKQEGVSESFLASVKAPIGLDIGARSPQEIAVAIHAEIIKCFNDRNSSADI
jgi:xanthine dehydrogenase accessory factor